ncbi:hypothetical protein BGZ58_002230 [Dissophora ornata]|nr:hypothetical protein BGZ58_002230 [Dissophora ornata]
MKRPHELYVEQHSLEQYDAIGFFDFCAFSSGQRHEAIFQWKSIVLPFVLQEDAAQHKRLLASWEESKWIMQQYWDSKKKKEKRDAQLDDHIDCLRTDTLKQTQDISKSITRDVGERLQGEGELPATRDLDSGVRPRLAPFRPSFISTSISASTSEARTDLGPSATRTSISGIPRSATTKKSRTTYATEEPWCSLTLSFTKIINGEKNVRFPAPLPSMSPIHAELFQHAVKSMQEYQAQDAQEKNITLLKDAQ